MGRGAIRPMKEWGRRMMMRVGNLLRRHNKPPTNRQRMQVVPDTRAELQHARREIGHARDEAAALRRERLGVALLDEYVRMERP